MENNFGEQSSDFYPIGPLDMYDLNFSPLNEQQFSNLFQPQPTRVPTQLLSSFQDLESQDLGNNVNNDDLPSDFLDPRMLMLDSSQAYEPARTPEPAPQFVQELLPSEYHNSRAEWHCNAEKFHRNKAQELVEWAQIYGNLESHPKQPVSGINSSNEPSPGAVHAVSKNHVSKSEGEHASKRNKGHQNHPSRISHSGAVQKIVAPTTSLPADLSAALMTESSLQKHANITDTTQIHPRVLQRVLFKPETVYRALHRRPDPWGHYVLNGETVSGRFKYNEFGELEPVSFPKISLLVAKLPFPVHLRRK